MRYWWVNQNQTFRHEVAGGYLWSPKRNKNGARNPFYDFMRVVAPGDVVFSFADTKIKAVGIIASHGYEAPKPMEFGSTGAYWVRAKGARISSELRQKTLLFQFCSFRSRHTIYQSRQLPPLSWVRRQT
jgi:putative restriction endonuclease